jgi:murein DD-endopeptidase MepM/ murein hydrolase activator NlpD
VVSKAEWFSSYGLYVALEHGADIQTRYGHMSRLNVYAGQRVRKGDVIGYIGSTGRSTGPHLHYEVRIAGLAVNPVPYMQTDSSETMLAANSAASGLTAKP